MAEFPKTYSEAADFPGGKVNTTKLDKAIRDHADITTGIWGVDQTGDVVTVKFKADPSATEMTALDGDTLAPAGGLIAKHDNTPGAPGDTLDPRVGGPKQDLDGVSLSASESSWTKADYNIPEDYHLQGVHAQWQNGKLGDYVWLAVIHPLSQGVVAVTAAVAATTVDVGAALAPYYNPVNGAAYIEFWDNAETVLHEVRKIVSVSGNVVTFSPGLAAERNTTVKIKARYSGFSPIRGIDGVDGGLRILNGGEFMFYNELAITDKLLANLIMSVRLRTVSAVGLRELVCNPIFRKPG